MKRIVLLIMTVLFIYDNVNEMIHILNAIRENTLLFLIQYKQYRVLCQILHNKLFGTVFCRLCQPYFGMVHSKQEFNCIMLLKEKKKRKCRSKYLFIDFRPSYKVIFHNTNAIRPSTILQSCAQKLSKCIA